MSSIARFFFSMIASLTLLALFWLMTQAEVRSQGTCLNSISVANTADSGPGTLRRALANVCSGGTINFAPTLANQTISLTSEELSITKTLTITNPNAPNLKVSGNDARRVFNIQAGAVVTLSGLSIINGTATGGCGFESCGAGILVGSGAELNINRCTLSNNSANYGGGIRNNGGTVTINHSTIRDNMSITYNGGGIYNYGTMTINHSIISGNLAPSAGGIRNAGTLMVNHSSIIDNVATYYGGGIFNSGVVTITLSTFSGNSAGNGGGILNNYYGAVTINYSTLISNIASYGGGGISTASPSTLTINHSTLSGNSASSYGGGISTNGTVTVNSSTFSNNSAQYGGGIQNYHYGELTINHSTFSNNSATSTGGGIRIGGGWVFLRNSIVANSSSGGDCYNGGTILINLNNLIEDGSCNPALSGDPNLNSLADNGGPTFTHALIHSSPAIDAGSCSGITADQRGFPRPVDVPAIPNVDDGCDIGAYEFGSLMSIYLPIVLK